MALIYFTKTSIQDDRLGADSAPLCDSDILKVMENLKRLKSGWKVRKTIVLYEGVNFLGKYTKDEILRKSTSKISIKL